MAGLLSGIGSALDSGAVDAAVDAGSSAMDFMDRVDTTTTGGFFDNVADYATDAFGWLNDNPEAANLIGGVAAGVGQAYLQGQQAEDQRAFEMKMYKRRREDAYAKPGQVSGYGSHRQAITRGAITDGDITGDREEG
ncbi:hypothetical protein ACGTNG_12510 [Halomonas sp. 1390]|uniref:hypothetical protein n=1 Tax=Halomonas sp. B23F22_3 TaxID=3459516 RepID=UPI00373E9295